MNFNISFLETGNCAVVRLYTNEIFVKTMLELVYCIKLCNNFYIGKLMSPVK